MCYFRTNHINTVLHKATKLNTYEKLLITQTLAVKIDSEIIVLRKVSPIS